jgi:hypothetical protein
MTSAAPVFAGRNRALVRSLSLALLTAAGIGGASAQSAPPPPSANEPSPVAMNGWRYEHSGADTHVFRCDQPSCGAGSKVSYRLYPAGNSMTLDQFRESQGQIVKALQQRTPGQQITILGVDGDKGTAVPRMFRARRLTVKSDGVNEYQVNGLLFGAKASASLISSARDEKASKDNYAKFMLALAPKIR